MNEKLKMSWEDLEEFRWYISGYHEIIYNLIEMRNNTRSAEEFGNKISGYIDGLCDYKDMNLKFEELKEKK